MDIYVLDLMGSNRTFMELKFVNKDSAIGKRMF